jgi:hypothetical protein
MLAIVVIASTGALAASRADASLHVASRLDAAQHGGPQAVAATAERPAATPARPQRSLDVAVAIVVALTVASLTSLRRQLRRTTWPRPRPGLLRLLVLRGPPSPSLVAS